MFLNPPIQDICQGRELFYGDTCPPYTMSSRPFRGTIILERKFIDF
jgi:hypothetical protein